MHFLPILSTLRRHRTAATLIVLEIALTCAIVCNAIFLIGDRLSRMDKPSGIAEDEIVHVQLAGIGKGTDADAITKQDFAALRALPGVKELTDFSMILPVRASFNIADNYIIRTSDVGGTLAAAEATLMKIDPARIVLKKRPFSEIRAGYFKQDRAMAYLLVGVCVVLLVIT